MTESEWILEPAQRRRYADAIVKAGLGVALGDTLVVQAEPAHRELAIEVVAAGYRAGATIVELQYYDPLVTRARLLNGRDESLGAFSPWAKRRMQELAKPSAARAAITGESEPGYLDGIAPKKIGLDFSRAAEQSKAFRRANLDMRARWTGAGWPTDFWAGQVYPDLSPLEGKRRLAQDFLWFCRLTDEDGKGSTGWLKHTRALARRAVKLTKLGLVALELRGPGTALDVGLASGTRWLGGPEETQSGVKITPNMPTEETFTSPDAGSDERHVRVHVPALVPRPPDRRAARRVPRRQARSARGEQPEGSRLRRRGTSTATRPATAAGSARSRSSTRPRASARAGARTSTRSTTRTPPRTSPSAPASAARARTARAASTAPTSIST